jgi:hypothetical protein
MIFVVCWLLLVAVVVVKKNVIEVGVVVACGIEET